MRTLEIERSDLLRRIPERHQGRYDCAGARPGDIVEVIGEDEVVAPELFSQEAFDASEELDGDQSTDAAAVDREQFLRAGFRNERLQVIHAAYTNTTLMGRSRRMMSQSACSMSAARPSVRTISFGFPGRPWSIA